VIGGAFVIERNTILSLKGFRNIVLGPDSDLFERAGKQNITMAEIKVPTYVYHYENPELITNTLYMKVNNP